MTARIPISFRKAARTHPLEDFLQQFTSMSSGIDGYVITETKRQYVGYDPTTQFTGLADRSTFSIVENLINYSQVGTLESLLFSALQSVALNTMGMLLIYHASLGRL